ncbi:hypothetical protein [Comamonas sediminis]|uniref:Uncharacterized protein n=1 Tax=Comamonas sediminis TaxID=1783360 RepID=A0ABV4B752_9BURK
MTDKTEAKPEALRLANWIDSDFDPDEMLEIGYDAIAAELRRQHAEIERLRALAATCYAGLGGECDLPVIWLDALNDAANGEPFDTEGLLPYTSVIRAQLVAQANRIAALEATEKTYFDRLATLAQREIDLEVMLHKADKEAIKQTNRAAAAEQQVTALTQRLDMANRLNTDAREQLAQLSARQSAPDGWRLVPVEPTQAMTAAGCPVGEAVDYFDMGSAYRAMLSAAPTAPEREPLSQHDLERLVGNWFAEGWAKKAAFGMLDDYERTQNRSHQ